MQSSSSYKSVVFHLRKDQDRIFLTLNGDKKSDLTPFMNDAWECRFKVNNEGEFLPWQVAQKALEEILF